MNKESLLNTLYTIVAFFADYVMTYTWWCTGVLDADTDADDNNVDMKGKNDLGTMFP